MFLLSVCSANWNWTAFPSAEVGATESTSQDPASKDGDDKWVSVTADEQGKPPNAQSCNWSKEAATLPSAQQQHDTHQQLALGIHLLTKQHSALISSVSISNVYLSPPIACGVCKLVAHNTSSVLVCDGCESAFHVACLQLYDDPMVIPRCDWYCPKCVAASGGRPQTPKYGPLRHGHDLQGSTHGSWGLQVLLLVLAPFTSFESEAHSLTWTLGKCHAMIWWLSDTWSRKPSDPQDSGSVLSVTWALHIMGHVLSAQFLHTEKDHLIVVQLLLLGLHVSGSKIQRGFKGAGGWEIFVAIQEGNWRRGSSGNKGVC